MVTWPGFQATPDGGSRVFVQVTSEVKPTLKQDGANWMVVLPNVELPKGNARLPLDTHFFDTPLKSVRLKPREQGGAAMHLEMKPGVSVEPKLRTEKAANGYFFVYVEFSAAS